MDRSPGTLLEILRSEGFKPPYSKYFLDGLKFGIWLYSWWKNGIQYVGTTGKILESTLKEIENLPIIEEQDEKIPTARS